MKDQQQLQNDRPIQREIAVVTAFGVVLVVLHGVAFVWSTIELIFFRLLFTTLHQWLSSFFLHPSPASRPRNVPIAVSSQRFRGSPPTKKQDSVGFSCTSLRCSPFFLFADYLRQDGVPQKPKRAAVPLHRTRIRQERVCRQDDPRLFSYT